MVSRKTKIFTWGTFNILHEGHKEFLRSIKSFCNEIHIILIPNNEVFGNKHYIPLDWNIRRAQIEELDFISYIHYDSYNLGLKSLIRFKPDFFVLGYDQTTIWEEKLVSFIINNELDTKIIRSQEFAEGIHCFHLRNQESCILQAI